MKKPLHILLVEDNPDDADLLLAELRRAGFDPRGKRVETEQDFLAEMKKSPDIILCDYTMPRFNGLRAAELLRKYEWDIPFILVSGTMGEDVAVEAMRHGATDYLLKDRIMRLGSAVESALEQKRLRDEHKRMQKQLVLHATALETVANAVMITNRAGTILWVNPAFTTSTGYTLDEAIGNTPRLLKSGKHDQALYGEFWETILSGDTWRGDLVNRRKDGSLYNDELTVTPVRSADGEITHFIGIMHDVTERKKAEQALRESEEKFRQLAENINEVFWITDPAKHQMLYISPAFEKIWGRTCNSIYQSPQIWFEVIHPEDRQRVLEAALNKKGGGDYDETYRIIRPDGSVRWIYDRAFPIRKQAGQMERVVGVARDITEHKRAQTELEKTHGELLAASRQAGMAEFANGVLHNVGNVLNSVAVASTCMADSLKKSKSADLARVVELMSQHEADLGAFFTHDPKGKQVSGYLAKLAERLTGEHATALKEWGELQKNVEHIKNIISVQQDSAKMSRSPEALQLTDLIEDALNVNSNGLRSGGIQVNKDFDEVPPIIIEKHKVLQILINLVRNAMQACETVTSQEKRLTIRLSQGAVRVRIAVTDNGSGISTENLSRIFSHGFTTKKDGHGFGLHSAARAAKEMGGSLAVQSEGSGRGATFTLELPMKG